MIKNTILINFIDFLAIKNIFINYYLLKIIVNQKEILHCIYLYMSQKASHFLISIPFFQRPLISTLCFTHYSMICKQVEMDFPDVSIKLVLVGSEGDISRNLALNFVEPQYYIEFPQIHKEYVENLKDKFKAAMECLKAFPHDMIFKMGSDDLITYDFFFKVINLYKTGNYNNHVFCNGIYSSAKRSGGIIIINYDTDNGVIIHMLGKKTRDPNKSSMSMGAWAFTKEAMTLLNYDPGYSEVVLDNNIYDKKIPRTIIEQIFYDIKKNDQISCYSYNDYMKVSKHVKYPLDGKQIKDYRAFISNVKRNVPEPLKYLLL